MVTRDKLLDVCKDFLKFYTLCSALSLSPRRTTSLKRPFVKRRLVKSNYNFKIKLIKKLV